MSVFAFFFGINSTPARHRGLSINGSFSDVLSCRTGERSKSNWLFYLIFFIFFCDCFYIFFHISGNILSPQNLLWHNRSADTLLPARKPAGHLPRGFLPRYHSPECMSAGRLPRGFLPRDHPPECMSAGHLPRGFLPRYHSPECMSAGRLPQDFLPRDHPPYAPDHAGLEDKFLPPAQSLCKFLYPEKPDTARCRHILRSSRVCLHSHVLPAPPVSCDTQAGWSNG